AVGCWAVVTALAALVWWAQTRRRPADAPPTVPDVLPTTPPAALWRHAGAWHVTAFMGLQSCCYFLLVTWLPSIEAARGLPAQTTGQYLLVAQVVSIVAGLAVTVLMGRRRDQRWVAVGCTLPAVVAAVGLVAWPSAVLVWAVALGLSTGTSLVVALALMGLRSRTSAQTARLSGLAQSGGYALAALSVVVAGAVGHLAGPPAVPFVILAVALAQLVVAPLAGRPRYIGGDAEPARDRQP
ncbi:MFS transporter, partial [Desertihabitans aurantiacus]|uniref:MFS transporter n=1 Tax=Desertihabitans aurantiacus TaxID=2282477 RepID=UPI002FCDD6C1